MNPTVAAFRQIVYSALTSPQLTYMIDIAGPNTLPIANVVPKAVWLAGGAAAPDPLVAFTVAVRSRGTSKFIPDRDLLLRIWCVASDTAGGQDCVTGLYEAVRKIFHTGDQDQTFAPDLSRQNVTGAGAEYGAAIRSSVESHVSDPDYENTTQRWYALAEFEIVAV